MGLKFISFTQKFYRMSMSQVIHKFMYLKSKELAHTKRLRRYSFNKLQLFASFNQVILTSFVAITLNSF